MMLKYILAAPAAIVCSVMLPGCGQSYSSAEEVVEELCDIIESVNDEASARKAVARLNALRPAGEKYKEEIKNALYNKGPENPKLQAAVGKLFGLALAKHKILHDLGEKVPEFKEAMASAEKL